MSVTYRGETFSGYNKPKRTPKHKTKSHAVLAKKGDKVKLVRFGQQGVKDALLVLLTKIPVSRICTHLTTLFYEPTFSVRKNQDWNPGRCAVRSSSFSWPCPWQSSGFSLHP